MAQADIQSLQAKRERCKPHCTSASELQPFKGGRNMFQSVKVAKHKTHQLYLWCEFKQSLVQFVAYCQDSWSYIVHQNLLLFNGKW